MARGSEVYQQLTEVASGGESSSPIEDPSCAQLSSPRKPALVWMGAVRSRPPRPDAKGVREYMVYQAAVDRNQFSGCESYVVCFSCASALFLGRLVVRRRKKHVIGSAPWPEDQKGTIS